MMKWCTLFFLIYCLASGYNGEKLKDVHQNGEKKDIVFNGPEPENVMEDTVTNTKAEDAATDDESKRKYKGENTIKTAPNDQKKSKHEEGTNFPKDEVSSKDKGQGSELAESEIESNGFVTRNDFDLYEDESSANTEFKRKEAKDERKSNKEVLERQLADPVPESAATPLYSSETSGYWGKWGVQQRCPNGQYVYGFQLKSEMEQGNGDDTALNGIKMLCNGGGSITSKTERWGKWLASTQCKGNEPVTGFQIQIEGRQDRGDDTAANNVNLWCKGGYYIKGVANTKWGSWSNLLTCPTGKVVVGIQTRVEESCGSCDDTAVNGVKLLCGDHKQENIIPLRNAAQSSTWIWNTCTGNKCTADRAIDGNLATTSVTRGSKFDWWSAELTKTSKIERIYVTTTDYAFRIGKFRRFKVETRLTSSAPWTVCKGEYSMKGSYKPHVVGCNSPTIAKYIRLSVAGGPNLYLSEVIVEGVPVEIIPLRNAAQSSTWIWNTCTGNKCTADRAIDGNLATTSVTTGSKFDWWSAELTKTALIERILVTTTDYAFRIGKFRRFKVETRLTSSAPWTVCKGEYSIKGSYKPHVVKCNNPTIAKYIRLSVAGGPNLYLSEVKVEGTPVPAAPECNVVSDIVFLLDSSGSIGSHYQDEKNFLKAIAAAFGLSRDGSRAGVITFGSISTLCIKLNAHHDINSFDEAVDRIPFTGGSTRIDLALRQAQREFFSSTNGGRKNAPKVIIILTYGQQTKTKGSEDPAKIAAEMRRSKMSTIVVGIGSGVNLQQLRKISGRASNTFAAKSFNDLLKGSFLRTIQDISWW